MRDHTKDLLKALERTIQNKSGVDLSRRKTLVLNADYQPLKYFPLSLEDWKWVMEMIVKGMMTGQDRLVVLEEYDDIRVHTTRRSWALPSVVAHTQYVPPPKKVPFTKFNVFLRDDFTCQYTGESYFDQVEELTFDHIIPRADGGKTNWANIATACRRINEMKDNRTPKQAGLHLIKRPMEPTYHDLLNKGRHYPPKYLHDSWIDYLYWNSEIENEDDTTD